MYSCFCFFAMSHTKQLNAFCIHKSHQLCGKKKNISQVNYAEVIKAHCTPN